MKLKVMCFTVAITTLAFSVGCPKTAPPTVARYDSIAVVPISGELSSKFPGGPEKPKTFLQMEFPEELAREIAKQRPSSSLKVISPAVVQEKQRPELGVRELGKAVEAKTILVGKAVPDTNPDPNLRVLGQINFQLIDAETGDLLWGESFPILQSESQFVNNRPQYFHQQEQIIESVAKQVVSKLTANRR